MNKMRFGAILISTDWHVGFYLSHRVFLTIPTPGVVRAVSHAEFGTCKVFARNGVSIGFFEAMMKAALTKEEFGNSLEMVCVTLNLPKESDADALCEYMEHKYGAVLEEFENNTESLKNIQFSSNST